MLPIPSMSAPYVGSGGAARRSGFAACDALGVDDLLAGLALDASNDAFGGGKEKGGRVVKPDALVCLFVCLYGWCDHPCRTPGNPAGSLVLEGPAGADTRVSSGQEGRRYVGPPVARHEWLFER